VTESCRPPGIHHRRAAGSHEGSPLARGGDVHRAARADGPRFRAIHLMVATQRPSTRGHRRYQGYFPARVSLVASRPTRRPYPRSRPPRNLLGMGDCLILPRTSTLTRVARTVRGGEGEGGGGGGIPLRLSSTGRRRARRSTTEHPQGRAPRTATARPRTTRSYELTIAIAAVPPTSLHLLHPLLQRTARGLQPRALMIERMERDGIVGPADGAKPRELLIVRSETFPCACA